MGYLLDDDIDGDAGQKDVPAVVGQQRAHCDGDEA